MTITQTPPHSIEPYHILIVDDTSILTESTVERLHQAGFTSFEYQTAASFDQVETLLQQRAWDVILCTYVHTPFETTDLLRLAQRLQPQTPVIVVREQVTSREAFELGRLGVQDFFETAVTQRLLDCIQRTLSAKLTGEATNGSVPSAVYASPAYQLELILNSMHDAIISISLPDRRLIFASSSYERVFGFPLETYLKDRDFYKQVVSPDELEMANAAVQSVYREGYAELDHRVFSPDGSVRWLHRRAWIIYDPQGNAVQLVDTARDITERKRAEAALQEANRLLEQRVRERTAELQEERNLLRTVIDAIPDFIYVKDRQHRMLLNNLAHIRSVGMANGAEMIGKTDLDLFPQSMAVQFHADEDRLFELEQAIINLEEQSIRPDGSDAWMLTTKVPLRSVQGELIGLVGITRDINSIKAAGEALRISEERYRATVAAMSEGLIVHDKDGAIQLCNSAAEQILGLTVDQMLGRTSVDPRWHAIHEDGTPFPGKTHPALVTLRTGEPQANVVMGIHKPDDTLTWILVNSQSLIDPVDQKPYAVVATFADITAPKQAEAAIKAALAQEKELGELKSRFVSMASHEFRNPLASILTATETLTLYWERMDKAKINDRLNRIREQVDRMTAIMEDVLQLTRIQTRRTPFEPAPGDLDALCMRIMSDLTELPDYHDRIHYECSQRPLNAVFDARLLQQAITNLLHNALKYSAPETSVRITLTHADGQIALRVTDEGIGIPPEDVKRLFEPFHRAANVGEISGTGLGLAIAKEAVELHGGTITVESQLNVGTTLIVMLPDHPVWWKNSI